MADARRAGFATREAYACARSRELDRALAAAGARTARRRTFGVEDQEAIEHLAQLLDGVEEELRTVSVVITHAYEGGHPDHDACALLVQYACERLRRRGDGAPARLEFPSYHARRDGTVTGAFWPTPGCPERVTCLDDRQLARKRAALAQFATQRDVIAAFPVSPERLRPAPRYDFARPPPPGEVLYDRFGWRLTGAAWRRRALAMLERHG